MGMGRTIDVAGAFTVSVARLGAGLKVGSLGKRPEKPLELYEFEACPFCRKVRETLTYLDLDAMVYPCPKNGPTYRPKVQEEGGKMQFPYLVDPNTGERMYESDRIVGYLFDRYGGRRAPFLYSGGPVNLLTSSLGVALRGGKGVRYTPSSKPDQPLELYSFEGSPYCRIVREVLCSLELPYLLHNVGKGSPSRAAFVERSGRMMVPYLVDPNTGKEMFESADIKHYLLATYAP
jgi:glutathione S-transferase